MYREVLYAGNARLHGCRRLSNAGAVAGVMREYLSCYLVVKGNLIFDAPFNDLSSIKDVVF
jgi:hypothetical protein